MPVVAGSLSQDQPSPSAGSAVGPGPARVEPEASEQALALLHALSDPIRLQVVEALARGERCVCELTGELALGQSKLSFHLKVLRQAGLISARRQGRWIYYRLEPVPLASLRDWLGRLAVGCGAAAVPCS
jgi:ArsR family transcriptional regulator